MCSLYSIYTTVVSLFMVPSCGILCHTTCGQLTYLWPLSEIDWKHSCLTLTRSTAFASGIYCGVFGLYKWHYYYYYYTHTCVYTYTHTCTTTQVLRTIFRVWPPVCGRVPFPSIITIWCGVAVSDNLQVHTGTTFACVLLLTTAVRIHISALI